MPYAKIWTGRFLALVILWTAAPAAAELPSGDTILQIYRENRQQLSRIHLQLVHRYEMTEASCRIAQKEAAEKERIFNALSQVKAEDLVFHDADKQPITGEQAQQILRSLGGAEAREEIRALKGQVKPFQTIRPMEFFLDAENYQFRQPVKALQDEEELRSWKFSDVPLTSETLLTTYRDIGLFSRSSQAIPPSRWWHHSADRAAYVMQKHLTDVWRLNLPPFTDATHPEWDCRHAFDTFFSQPAEKYRVVREEEIDGRLLTVVDVAVPIGREGSTLLCYRGWLDLRRGAIPVKVHHQQGRNPLPDDFFDRLQPQEIVTTSEIHELPEGGFYPTKTLSEQMRTDPDHPQLTPEEWKEVRQGHRKIPQVVVRRHRWECSLAEKLGSIEPDFFVIPFPEGQQLFDHDAGKMIGALEPAPPIPVGEPAPPLQIARWLDGQQHSLEEFRGKVVVLDFWGLWCSACRGAVPTYKILQERFKDQPVVFISIHTAEKDAGALSEKIKQLTSNHGWDYLAGIDSGTMIENSATSCAYGVQAFPTEIIIGRDGLVKFNSMIPPPGFEELYGKTEEELSPQDFKKFEDWERNLFLEAGEAWPLPETLSEQELEEIHTRVAVFDTSRRINAALAEDKEPVMK